MEIIGFTKHNPKHHTNLLNWPEEDSFKFLKTKDKIILAVADGITRDPIDFPKLPDMKTILGELETAIEYPIPSPARKAADLFCESFIKFSKNTKPSIENLKKIIEKCNNQIKILNKKNNPHPDYLVNDHWACVASATIIENETLYWTYITDCGIAVFDKKGKLKFQTKNEQPNPKISKQILKEEIHGESWRDPGVRKRTRLHYRNNPQEPLSYGAFTGEATALEFTRFGKIKIEKDDIIILYSDGFHTIISSKKFNPTKNLEKFCEKHSDKIDGSEGTILAILP